MGDEFRGRDDGLGNEDICKQFVAACANVNPKVCVGITSRLYYELKCTDHLATRRNEKVEGMCEFFVRAKKVYLCQNLKSNSRSDIQFLKITGVNWHHTCNHTSSITRLRNIQLSIQRHRGSMAFNGFCNRSRGNNAAAFATECEIENLLKQNVSISKRQATLELQRRNKSTFELSCDDLTELPCLLYHLGTSDESGLYFIKMLPNHTLEYYLILPSWSLTTWNSGNKNTILSSYCLLFIFYILLVTDLYY